MASIKLKTNIKDDKMSDGLLYAMKAINTINESEDEFIEIDFSEVGFVTPLYVLPLVMFINSCNKKISINNINEYLETIKFSNGMYPDRMRKTEFKAIMQEYTHKTYIPIISFPSTKSTESDKDEILSSIETIIIEQLNISLNVATGIKYMLSECIDNIIQHANSERGYIFAQSYPQKGYLDICIADNGITLLGSYKTLKNNEIESDLEAIQAANRGISTKNLPNAENRGYGIITSKNMLIDGLKGNFIMMSGNALHLHNSESKHFIDTPFIRFNGTIIALRIPYMNKNFNYINHIE